MAIKQRRIGKEPIETKKEKEIKEPQEEEEEVKDKKRD